MTKRDRVLWMALRVIGILALFALVPMCMPASWLAGIHRWLGLGEMPSDPVTEYLARSLSAYYALFGALSLALASDLDRYRPLVRLFAVSMIAFGIALVFIDWAAGMPPFWIASEGPPTLLAGVLVLALARDDG